MKKGFTLVEIMIVVAIIIIISSVGYVNIGDRVRKDNEKKAKIILPTVIRASIDKAFAEGRGYHVNIPVTGSGNIIITKDNVGTGPAIEDSKVQIPKGIITYTTSPSSVSAVDIGQKGEIIKDVEITVKSKNMPYYQVRVKNISGINIGSVKTYIRNNSVTSGSAVWVEESGK